MKYFTIIITLGIITGFFWLNLTPTIGSEDIEIKAELVKAEVTDPGFADSKYAIEISVDNKKKIPLSVYDKYIHTIYFYIDGFVPNINAQVLAGESFNTGVYISKTALPVINAFKDVGIDYPATTSGPDFEGLIYESDIFPAKIKYHIRNRQIVDPNLPGVAVQNK